MFQPGHKLAPGGRRNGAGRPKKIQAQINKAASEIAREYINASVKPVLATYFQLAHGRLVNKWHEGNIVGSEFEADAPTTRHFIDKILPDKDGQTENRPIAIQIIHEGRADIAVTGSGNGVGIHIGSD